MIAETKKLEEVATLLSGKTPRRSNDSYWGGETPWVSAKDLTSERIYGSEDRLTEAGAAEANRIVPPGTVLFVVRGMSLDSEFRVSLSKVETAFNQDLKAVSSSEEIDDEFLFYYLLSIEPEIIQIAGEASHGTKKLPTDVLYDLEIPVPSRSKQEKVVDILSAFDDLIKVNRERIEQLEQAARLLYREWFIHYRFPGYEHTSINEGVPEEWDAKSMSDVCETFGGGTPKTSIDEYWENGEIEWFTPSDITAAKSLVLLSSERKINREGLRNSSAQILPPNTILMTSRASVGYFGMYEGRACTNQGFISLVPKREKMRMYLLYNLMSRRKEIDKLASGSTYKEISQKTFKKMEIVIPPDSLLEEFGSFVTSAVKQMRTLEKQNRQLQRARDILLPRLMSGEITV